MPPRLFLVLAGGLLRSVLACVLFGVVLAGGFVVGGARGLLGGDGGG